jgi:superfamily I DNA/RNA helicase
MFAWSKAELNAEQEAAIMHPGSVFLRACPGSGKTRALTYKVALELSKPELGRQFIAAITYTHRAADEIKERIQDLGVDTTQLWIGTIHAFCLEWILGRYGIYHEKLARGFRVMDQHEQEKLFEKLCEPFKMKRLSSYDCGYHFETEGYVPACRDPSKTGALDVVFQKYFNYLDASRLVDFELILFRAFELLANRQTIATVLSRVFSFILIDEYQDTKRIQYSIVASILRAGGTEPRAFIVGDPNQAIYDSLGGFAIDPAEFEVMCGREFEKLALKKNFRSASRVVDYFSCFALQGDMPEVASPDAAYPSMVTYNREVERDDLLAEIEKLIRFNVETKGIKPKEICVLGPQWLHLASMTRRLAATMPEYQFDGPGMVPFSRDTENFWYKLARIALTAPAPGLFVRRLRWANEVIRDLEECGIAPSGLNGRQLLRKSNSLAIDEDDGLAYLRTYFESLFESLAIPYDLHESLSSPHTAFFESSVARVEKLRKEGPNYIGDIASFRRVFQPRSGITVSTIHGVKGAEFDAVIAFALLEGMIPHFADPGGRDSAMKLLYVTTSRARKNIHLISERGRLRWKDTSYGPTVALAECSFDYDSFG